MHNLYTELVDLLNKDERLTSEGKLLKNKIVELAYKIDKDLIKLLLSNPKFKELFFQDVEGVLIFNQSKFQTFISNKEFLPDSFTSFKNKIGLTNENGEFISQSKEVVLSFPYKDCVLEGGQDKEDAKRDEIFYNKVLASDEIDRLFEPKVLTNFRKFDKDGEHTVNEISENDNLIIKGNNLIALHSLKKTYAGKVKLIYIDPPYNPTSNNNTFAYNNSFNHSTWLTFMKNRLEVAKELLAKDGAMIIAIDENEQSYLGVMIDEVFKEYENHCITIVHNPRGVQGTNFSYTHEYAFFIFPKGTKTIKNRKISEEDIKIRGLRDNGGESLRTDAKNCFFPIIVDKSTKQVIDFGEVCDDKFHPKINIHNGDFVEVYPIDKEGIERKWRYARQSIEKVKDLLIVSVKDGFYDIQIGKDFGQYRTVWIDKRYDANEYGTKLVKDLVPESNFSFPKSLWNVYDAIYAVVQDDKNAIVLDYHAGSGTTGHAVLELNKEDGGNRKFILVEQMDYIETVTTKRVNQVIKNNDLETSFVRVDLKDSNQQFLSEIQNSKDLVEVLNKIKQSGFLTHKVDLEKLDDNEFIKLSESEQRSLLMEILDANHLYVNLNDIDDARFKVSDEDKNLNKQFYSI